MEYTGERFILENDEKEIEAEHLHRYSIIGPNLKEKYILDAGCGSGYGSNILADYCHKVIGIDISSETIEWCNNKYGNKENLEFLQGSLEKLPFDDNVFDCVINLEVIEHVNEDIQEAFLKEARRVLKSDGFLIISTPNKRIYTDESNYKNPYHVHEFYPDEFKKFLKNEFSNVRMYNQELFMASSIYNEQENENLVKIMKDREIEDEEKYMIAICSNSASNIDININSVYKYENVKSNLSLTLYPEGLGINADESIKMRMKKFFIINKENEFEVEIDISKFKDIVNFRFDPLENEFCICNIYEASIDGEKCDTNPINATTYYKKGFVFLNIDPQFKINCSTSGKTLRIRGYCKVLNSIEVNKFINMIFINFNKNGIKEDDIIKRIFDNTYNQAVIMDDYHRKLNIYSEAFLSRLDSIIKTNNSLMNEKNSLINENNLLRKENSEIKSELINEKNKYNKKVSDVKEIENKLSAILNSRSWKATKPLRKLYKFLK